MPQLPDAHELLAAGAFDFCGTAQEPFAQLPRDTVCTGIFVTRSAGLVAWLQFAASVQAHFSQSQASGQTGLRSTAGVTTAGAVSVAVM